MFFFIIILLLKQSLCSFFYMYIDCLHNHATKYFRGHVIFCEYDQKCWRANSLGSIDRERVNCICKNLSIENSRSLSSKCVNACVCCVMLVSWEVLICREEKTQHLMTNISRVPNQTFPPENTNRKMQILFPSSELTVLPMISSNQENILYIILYHIPQLRSKDRHHESKSPFIPFK